jgi:glycosyltransferase involved in cell wall biosynthesis
MKIGIDITFLKDQYANRGIGVYGTALVQQLLKESGQEFLLFGFDDLESNLQLLHTRPLPNISFVSLGKARASTPFNPFFFDLNFRNKILKAKLDVFLATHFERGLPIGKVKTVVMMHDIIPLVTNKYSSQSKFFNYLKGRFYKKNLNNARKADLILTNSDFTLRELTLKGGFDPAKIVRTYLGVKDEFRNVNISKDTRDIRRILMLYKITKPYILYYGGIEPNKNIKNLILGFKNVLKRFPDLKLVIIGKEFKLGWDNKVQPLNNRAREILNLTEELKLKHNVILTGQADNIHLPVILNNAEALVHLSTYEGFGMTVLEGLAAGTPVIAARRSSYPEILKDAVEYVNPKEIDQIGNSIQAVLEDPKLRSTLIHKGLMLSEQYTWEKTAKETLAAIELLIAKTPPLNIGYLIPNFYPYEGGAEANCLALAKAMVLKGHQVKVFTSDSNHKDWAAFEIYEGIEIHRSRKLNNQYYLGYYPGLLNKLLTSKLDILHVHGLGFIWHDYCLLLKKFINPKLKIINTPHGPFMANEQYSVPKKILKWLFTNIQKTYVNGLYRIFFEVNPLQEKWLKDYGINKDKIVYLPNGIPSGYADIEIDENISKELKLNKKFVVTFIGRFEKYKGLQDLFSVIARITPLHKNIKLVAMGYPGAYLPELKALIIEKKLENFIDILEKPEIGKVKQILKVSKIFVLPSSWEAFGITILEAMSFGNAILSSRTEGGEFLIKENENGYIFDFGDTNELYNYLTKLIDDRKLLTTISENNLIKAKDFTWDKISLDYQKYLKEIIK